MEEDMRAIIGDAAGKVWRTLSQHKEISLSQIPKLVGEKDTVVYQAVGWLACEDKIKYRTERNRTLVSLR
jgi:hypothetical protein